MRDSGALNVENIPNNVWAGFGERGAVRACSRESYSFNTGNQTFENGEKRTNMRSRADSLAAERRAMGSGALWVCTVNTRRQQP